MIKLKQLIKENVIDDIIRSGKFRIEIGSGETGMRQPKKQDIKDLFKSFIRHNFFEWDFYYNYTSSDNKREYLDAFEVEILKPYMNKLDWFVKKYMDIEKDGMYVLKSNFDHKKFYTNYIKKSKKLSKETKQDYYNYRLSYAGEKVW